MNNQNKELTENINSGNKQQSNEPPKNKRYLVIALFILALLIVGGSIIGYFLFVSTPNKIGVPASTSKNIDDVMVNDDNEEIKINNAQPEANQNPATASWSTYKNEKYGISFKHPGISELVLRTNECGLVPGNPRTIELGLIATKDMLSLEKEGDLSMYFEVVLWDDGLTLEDWVDRYVFSEQFQTVLDSQKITIGNHKAILVNIGYENSIGKNVYFASNNHIYVFSLHTLEEGKNDVLAKFHDILSTIIFTKPTFDLDGIWRTYKHSAFKINFPSDWHFYDEYRYPEMIGLDITPIDFVSYHPELEEGPIISIALLSSFFDTNEEVASDFIRSMISSVPGFSIVLEDGIIAGTPGLTGNILIKRDDGSIEEEGKAFFVKNDEKLQFVIIYLYPLVDKNIYKKKFAETVSTLEFVEDRFDFECPDYLK